MVIISPYALIFAVALLVHTEARYADNCDLNAGARPSEACGKVIRHGLNDTQIQEILDAHNSTCIGSRKWSPELAVEAQVWADQCDVEFDPCVDHRASNISLSIIQMQNSGGDPSLTEMVKSMHSCPPISINAWSGLFDFDLDFDFFSRFRRRRSLTGDFTNTVGCGFITFKKTDWPINYLVCFYGPHRNHNISTTTSPNVFVKTPSYTDPCVGPSVDGWSLAWILR